MHASPHRLGSARLGAARRVPSRPSCLRTERRRAKDERRRRGKVNAARVPHHEASSHASSFMRSWERASRWVRSTPSFPAPLPSPSPSSYRHMLAGRFIFSCPVSLRLFPFLRALAAALSPSRLAPVSTSPSPELRSASPTRSRSRNSSP